MEPALIKIASKKGRATRKAEGSKPAKNARRKVKMGQEDNDLEQVRKCIKDMSNVYKSQVNDSIMDNGNISVINNVILGLKQTERWLIAHQPPVE